MPEVEEGYFSQGVDYLGFLNGELRGLQGIATLANELIQNADDAQASWISFDVCDDALVVENGALFSDCAEVGLNECPWAGDPARKHRCDWHRFRRIASGDKRRQGGTIGAFGIGFISVYQITDRPELASGRRHWTVNPAEQEGKRIYQRSIEHLPRTRFRLEWASDPDSPVRKALQVQPISDSVTHDTFEELMRVLPRAITFLRHVREIHLKRDGDLRRRVCLTPMDGGLKISDGGTTSVWRVINGSFEDEARRLKAEQGASHDRSSEVTIALPQGEEELNGVLFAFLPTQQHTGLPFHFNADFFTSPDRKRIPFENTYESRWNAAAVRCGAKALADALPTLPTAMGHKPFWRMLEQIERAHTSFGGDPLKLFNVFWGSIKNEIRRSRTVFTSQDEWLKPEDVFILSRQEDEKEALPILTRLGMKFVHEDLRKHYNLLIRNEVGVRVLTASDLAAALKAAGFDRPLPRSLDVEWMFEDANRTILGREIRVLLNSLPSEKVRGAQIAELGACAVALPSGGGRLVPPQSLFKADAATVDVFTRLLLGQHFVQPDDHEAIVSLVPDFALKDGVRLLAKLPAEHFQELWAEDKDAVVHLVRWLELQSPWITDDLKGEIRGLPIWVSGNDLHPLDDLVVPGNFIDPIGIASIIDIETLGVGSSFLLALGAKELTINTYASEQVRRRFKSGSEVKGEDRRRLVQLFSEKFSELDNDAKAQSALAACPVVECTDGEFRVPGTVYFPADGLRALLGDNVPVAVDPNHQSVRNLLSWLGVAQKPRVGDIVQRVADVTGHPPQGRVRDSVQLILTHLAKRWGDDLNEEPALSQLRVMAWLPASGDTSTWHKPDALYAKFQEYLFSSQARFLDVAEQGKLSDFLAYLGVKSKPTPELVVSHLLKMASENREVNKEVYTFLNQNATHTALARLVGRACLFLESQLRYVSSESVFWGEHPFGKYRFRLSQEMRGYGALFERLGVREAPSKGDAVSVLKELSDKFGATNSRLDDEAKSVVFQCWKLLNESPDQSLRALQTYKVVPNGGDILEFPGSIYFDDRPGYAEKLGLLNSVIPRPQDAWRAMQAAGVRPLSEAVQTILVDREQPVTDEYLRALMVSRKGIIARVVEAHRQEGDTVEWDLALLDELRVESVGELSVSYRLAHRRSPPVQVTAYYDSKDKILYFRKEPGYPWAALARELAYALNPQAEAGKVAPGLKEAISAKSAEDASGNLDELGYATLQAVDQGTLNSESVSIGASKEPSTDTNQPDPGGGQFSSPVPSGAKTDYGTSGLSLTPKDSSGGFAGRSQRNTNADAASARQPGTWSGGQLTDGSNQRPKDGEAPEHRRQRNRLLSYVMPDDSFSDTPPDTEVAEKRSQVDKAGINRVLDFERSVGRKPNEMDHGNKGFDIISFDPNNRSLRYIEVKSLSGDWDVDGVKLTSSQFESATEQGDRYWLYVVERAESEEFQIHRIKNPAAHVMYYVFDGGWSGLRELDDEASSPGEDESESENSSGQNSPKSS